MSNYVTYICRLHEVSYRAVLQDMKYQKLWLNIEGKKTIKVYLQFSKHFNEEMKIYKTSYIWNPNCILTL